jgi:hypothetical protein
LPGSEKYLRRQGVGQPSELAKYSVTYGDGKGAIKGGVTAKGHEGSGALH